LQLHKRLSLHAIGDDRQEGERDQTRNSEAQHRSKPRTRASARDVVELA
jgi:hypothetical protein